MPRDSRWGPGFAVRPPIMTVRRKLLASDLVSPQTIAVQRLIGRMLYSWYGFWAHGNEPGGSRLSSAPTIDWAR